MRSVVKALHAPGDVTMRDARRRLLCGSLVSLSSMLLPMSALAVPEPTAAAARNDVRMALLIGNRNYPPPFDLPPIPKNVRDLHGALLRRGFEVTDGLDLDLAAARVLMNRFIAEAAQAPQDATLFFYFSGHGVQFDAANLLLPAGINPSSKGELLRDGSLKLFDDIVKRIPPRREGITIAVIDACRTDLKSGGLGGLNQVEAPPGCLIAFSTASGRPAVAPAVETQNTFYTASLVKLMDGVSSETTFPDLMSLVRADVRNTMLNYPVEAIRELAQDPFIADHTRARVTVVPRNQVAAMGDKHFATEQEERDWLELQSRTWPAEVNQAAETFLREHPGSAFTGSAVVARDGSREAMKALQRNDVRLYRTAFQSSADMNAEQRTDITRAARGDKDAAARIAARLRDQIESQAARSRYEGWLQYAVALGNGIASYELALHYRRLGQPLLASQFEARALALGYNPPPDLDNVRK